MLHFILAIFCEGQAADYFAALNVQGKGKCIPIQRKIIANNITKSFNFSSTITTIQVQDKIKLISRKDRPRTDMY